MDKGSGQCSGQWAVGSGQWAVGSRAVGTGRIGDRSDSDPDIKVVPYFACALKAKRRIAGMPRALNV